ncbi:exportin-T [Lingula anatina]|uniref:Exportin-T n=1 Tax=Lingula anatina TaxID=7574 RepID=A0A1S3HAB0_LINAN|nr:exportin-T [Lingula anatina]XP_013382050.1 exportin-T [Lingula anatina]|eukprot:XP_013382049.1 exportin-T [Lingula anatina]
MEEVALQGLDPQVNDPAARALTLQYFEQLKASEDGWRLCAASLTSGRYHSNDHIQFFCYQVIEHFLKTSYVSASPVVQRECKTFLMTVLQLQSQDTTKNKTFLRNKVAQVLSLAFVCDYPQRWPSFFQDLLQLLSMGPLAVDMYLKVLVAIDSEVVDRDIVHTQQETERNTMIKDTMRVDCVAQLVDSWYQIITGYESSNPETVCLCLDIIGKYVSWIDINMIANNKFVEVLIRFMRMNLLRESACDCIHEIISKGMDPVAKTKLIESFTNVLDSAGVIHPTEDEEGDFVAKLSKLVNGMGLQLIQAWQKLVKAGDSASSNVTMQAFEHKVPLMFRFLGDEDDDVSGAIITFAHDYISVLKQVKTLSEKQRQNIEGLLFVVVKKLKYDESYNFDQEGEEEAMFQEYRKQLKTIFNNLAQLDNQLIVAAVHSLVASTLQNWRNMEHQEVEVAIYLLYILGETIPPTQGPQFRDASQSKTTALQEMMRLLVTCGVSHTPHTAVTLQMFETIVRYEKFFLSEPQHIPAILTAFLDERGLHNKSKSVRSRVSYLFSRFIKGIRAHVQSYENVQEILTRIADLLVLNTPDNGLQISLTSVDKLFMYETAGTVIVSGYFPPEKKAELMKALLAPIVSKFDSIYSKMCAETDETKQFGFAQSLSHAMNFASRASKAFSNQQTMRQCSCVEPFTETLQIFLHVLNTPCHRQLLQTGVRQYLHRMVVCLESEILPYVPLAMEQLLKDAEAKELYDFLPLMNQVISKFKKEIVPFLQQIFMPVVTTIFQALNKPSDQLDQIAAAEKKLLHKGYFGFISTILNQDVAEILTLQESHNLYNILVTVVQGAVDFPDPSAQKLCFQILKKTIELWGDPGSLSGFEDFIYKNVVPACFMAPMKSTFDLKDAQTVLALGESGLVLKTVLEKRGDEFVVFLQTKYLPEVNMTPETIQEYTEALKSDPKIFKSYLKAFFARFKS